MPLLAAPFPAKASAPPDDPALASAGLALRRARASDMVFLRALFGDFRALEMAMVPWSLEQKRAFLDDQFALQHAHFTRYFPRAGFWIVTRQPHGAEAEAIGRLYLDRSEALWRIVDIGLASSARGAGIGTALLRRVQAWACETKADGVALNVSLHNPLARQLYLRLGFADAGSAENQYQPMQWRAPVS